MNTKYLQVLSALIALAVLAPLHRATAEEAKPAPGAVIEPAADAEAAPPPEAGTAATPEAQERSSTRKILALATAFSAAG